MKRGLSNLLYLALLLPLAASAHAEQDSLLVDPSRSSVTFTLSDVLHTVRGAFAIERGQVGFSRHTGTMTGQIEVDAASGRSGNRVRDERMTKEELHAGNFPSVTFAPTQFHGTIPTSGKGTIDVQGQFTLLGHSHPVQLPMTIEVSGTTCHAEGTFVVPYVAWGLHDPRTFVLRVAKQVDIHVELSGTLKAY
jgi:polyisoprenoid-binding protein YceI